ncbi:GGDEF domain-containing protein [Chitinilyticum piscinae]|uniref:diguanylate cyclase n=1 Tax=Chitinilyticum piscinae TaxID=2866724 RepID=A0A8J7K1Z7_9NEIS|nr:GGDEF domain-containing protein [Chitinilyticum piscinae]MBE9609337.1 GGDEF domain-containing protein [Chitinilyticum piscinae]
MSFFRQHVRNQLGEAPATLLTLTDPPAEGRSAAEQAGHPGRLHLWHQQLAAWAGVIAACLMIPLHFLLGGDSPQLAIYSVYLLAGGSFATLALLLDGQHAQRAIWAQRLLVAVVVPWLAVLAVSAEQPAFPLVLIFWPLLGLWLLMLTTTPGQWLFCMLLALPALTVLTGLTHGLDRNLLAAAMLLIFIALLATSVQMAHLRRRVRAFRQRVAEREAHLNARADKMRKLALRDALTGLSNRLHLIARLRKVLEDRQRRYEGATLFLIDLDYFKQINDEHGHDAGDAVLIEVAARLRRVVRHEDLVCRLGGDEFVLLIEGKLLQQHAEQLADKILHSFSQPCVFNGEPLPIGGSIGIASLHAGLSEPESWLKEADEAMYIAKHGGKNRFAVHTPVRN